MWENLIRTLEGELVRLEPLAWRHEEGLYEAAGDGGIWRWMQYGSTTGREPFRRWVGAAIGNSESGTEGAFATIDAGTGRPIGSTRFLALRPEHRGLEIGWTWLAPAYWGTGANVEAKLLMLEHAFEGLGCMRVELKTDRRNERSRNAIAALPARFEGIFRKHMILPDGTVRDSAYYSITDDEWPEVKANLRRRLDAVVEKGGGEMSAERKTGERRATVAGAFGRLPGPDGELYARMMHHGTMEVEVYAPRGRDPQTPHSRDELYFVVSGSGRFVNGADRHPFGPGDALFVPAGVEHRFEEFTDDLVVWVVFYGPEGGEAPGEEA